MLVAFSAIIPLMTVVNYSVQDIFGPGQRVWVGTEWFEQVLGDEPTCTTRCCASSCSQACVLLIEIPLGVADRAGDARARLAVLGRAWCCWPCRC